MAVDDPRLSDDPPPLGPFGWITQDRMHRNAAVAIRLFHVLLSSGAVIVLLSLGWAFRHEDRVAPEYGDVLFGLSFWPRVGILSAVSILAVLCIMGLKRTLACPDKYWWYTLGFGSYGFHMKPWSKRPSWARND